MTTAIDTSATHTIWHDIPGQRAIYEGTHFAGTVDCVVYASVAAAVIGTGLLLLAHFTKRYWIVYALLALLAIGPPIWFMYEYHHIFKTYGVEKSFDAFKYGQDITAKMWAAMLTVVGGYAFKVLRLDKS